MMDTLRIEAAILIGPEQRRTNWSSLIESQLVPLSKARTLLDCHAAAAFNSAERLLVCGAEESSSTSLVSTLSLRGLTYPFF